MAQAMNGPMADWLLYANPDSDKYSNLSKIHVSRPGYTFLVPTPLGIPSNVIDNLNSHGYARDKFVFPFTRYTDGSSRKNHNLVGVNFYEKGPWVINAIMQNLKIAFANYYTG